MRLPSLWAAVFPVLLGAALSMEVLVLDNVRTRDIPVDPVTLFALCLLTAVFLQLACNYANDYYDELRGFHNDRPREQEVLARATLSVATYKKRFIFCITMAMICGAMVVFLAPVPWWARLTLLALGALCLLLTWAYSGSKHPYGDKGLGDLASFLSFGPIATIGTFYVVGNGHIPKDDLMVLVVILKAIAIGLMVAGQLMVDNIRDIPTDPNFGKITLAVRLGEKWSRIIYHIQTAVAILIAAAFMHTFLVVIPAGLFVIIGWVSQVQNLYEKEYKRAFRINALMALGLTIVMIL